MHAILNRNDRHDGEGDRGFTLVEILIAIVLVGILSAVVVVGISNLTSKGSKSACEASADAARSGAVVYYTSNGSYPTTFNQMTTATGSGATAIPPALTLPSGVAVNTVASTSPAAGIGLLAKTDSWNLVMTPGSGGAAPTFACV